MDRDHRLIRANGGSVKPGKAVPGADGRLGGMPVPEWPGHTFLGWYRWREGGDQVHDGDVFTSSAWLYAHWS